LFRLYLIDKRAQTFTVDTAEHDNRPLGRAKDEVGGGAYGKSMVRQGVGTSC
jgi:hypothetical protein